MALLIFLSSEIHATSNMVIPQELSRFIFKFYNVLPVEDFIASINKEIIPYYPGFNISLLTTYVVRNKNFSPGDLVRYIEMVISRCQKRSEKSEFEQKNINNMSENDWLAYISDAKLFLIFASENSNKAESTFGHISFLYKKKGSIYFDTIVTFMASDFVDQKTGKTAFSNYLKGAFTTLSGTFFRYPFFDAIYQNMLVENRILTQYRIDIDKETRKKIDKEIWNIGNSTSTYNFFTKNCSTEVFKLLRIKKLAKINLKYKTPAELIRVLSSAGIITYDGAYLFDEIKDKRKKLVFVGNEKYDLPKKSYNRSWSFFSTKEGFNISMSLFHFSRPYNGIVNRKSNISLMKISFLSTGSMAELTYFKPFVFNYTPLIYKRLGLKMDFSTGWENSWYIKTNTGLYLNFGQFRADFFYSWININKANKGLYFDLIYSNFIFDFLLKNRILSPERLAPEIHMNIFINNDSSLFFEANSSDYSLGLQVYY